MNRKRLGTGLLALALVGVVGIGGSLAWFTDSAEKENQITLGHVNIEMSEPEYENNSTDGEYNDVVTPGEPIYKDPTVTVVNGSEDARIRVKVEMSTNKGTWEGTLQEKLSDLQIQLEDGWTVDGDYLYYNNAVAAGTELKLFKESTDKTYTMKLPIDWDNDFVGATITINFVAEAVQADNTDALVNEDGVWDASLQGTEIKPYTTTIGE